MNGWAIGIGEAPAQAEKTLPRASRPSAAVDEATTQRAAKDFEAMTLDQLLQPMFATIDSDPNFGGGAAEETLKPLLVTEMAKMMEARGGLGLSSTIERKMIELQETQR